VFKVGPTRVAELQAGKERNIAKREPETYVVLANASDVALIQGK
jgi:hypothetical protein